ncbi:MAG: class I SAM-dependent methyltransferase [Thermoanaerobaculia bacterium]
MPLPALYTELASWFHLLTPPADYAEEAAIYGRELIAACAYPPRTLLELGSGGGNNASHMKSRFAMTLADLSPAMLELSRHINPECEHIEGDMRSIRLGREFDCVFVHDAAGYMATEDDLRQAIETAFVHCSPGGAALFAPDFIRETFQPKTDHGGTDGDGRALRYLEWAWDPDPDDHAYVVDFAVLLRERDGGVRSVQDRHVMGLFSREEWLRFLTGAGFEARSVVPSVSTLEPESYEIFVAKKPRS